ncbi:glycosyltransferase family 32 protein [Qingshengfaniella alkalisoli]|uniref:Capsular polysaccharide synthesis protein n=1 Tax=Qingshengfaniella alkalisoli TaxID=2599296 RepID=A0A5B8IXY4_9RHOB|nr:capsular polysaccharide synthesis protein [Qingshengfaniella alkalisoli]QDY70604.1 hypothetical protein FPZ52_12990 [Qingshengfaniella alkalisoli]
MNIPRRIHMLWLQGWQNAPDLARVCAEGWGKLNPNHDVVLHDASSVERQLARFPVPVAHLPPQAAADIFRASLLNSEGGIWADASLVPIQPLDDWFGDMNAFGFSAVGGWQEGRAMENWFLASTPGHAILSRFCAAAADYWTPERKTLIDVAWSGLDTGRVPVRQLKLSEAGVARSSSRSEQLCATTRTPSLATCLSLLLVSVSVRLSNGSRS